MPSWLGTYMARFSPQNAQMWTDRTLKHHLSQHCQTLLNADVTALAFAKYVWSTGHRVDFSKAEVVDGPPFCHHTVPP